MIVTTAPAKPANIMEALTREIERVAVIRERYALLGGIPGADIPTLTQDITRALWAAHEAAASGDALTVMRSLQQLQTFEEWGTGKLWELKGRD